MFKLPSLQSLLRETADTLKRFPPALLAALIAAAAAVYLNHCDYEKLKEVNSLWKIIMCCSLGLSLFIAAELFSESKNHSIVQRIMLQAAAVILIAGYYFSLPDVKDFGLQDGVRFALFTIGLHLLVSFSPFISSGHINGFWQFNKSLFLRFLTAGLYTGVLYLGLALALLAVEKLFKVEVKWKYYADLWWFLACIFNTWFFLSGVPKQTETLDGNTDYPKGLKIFTQFVLLPLVTVYLIILYAYGAKIAIAMQLPRGWVSYLVIGFSAAGILSLLLIWPIREREENSWIKVFSRWFYMALYPLIILLGLAVYKRVSQYGITENRYFILILAIWLAVIAAYFLLSKTKNIKVIPVSLCIVAFFSSFGPWGAFSISESSQSDRLEKLLIKEKLLVNGRIKKAEPMLKGSNAQKITSLVNYLDNVHGLKNMQPWFTQNLDSIFRAKEAGGERSYINKRGIVLDLMGVENYEDYSRSGETNFYIQTQNSNPGNTVSIKGFDYFFEFSGYYYNNSEDNNNKNEIFMDKDTLSIKFNSSKLWIAGKTKALESIDLNEFIKKIKSNNTPSYGNYIVPDKQLQLQIETDAFSIQLNFTAISGTLDEDGSTKINNVNARVLIKRK